VHIDANKAVCRGPNFFFNFFLFLFSANCCGAQALKTGEVGSPSVDANPERRRKAAFKVLYLPARHI
jgi:hypothetical protein